MIYICWEAHDGGMGQTKVNYGYSLAAEVQIFKLIRAHAKEISNSDEDNQYLQLISLTLEHASITTVNLERLVNLQE